jgi:cytochrome c5
MTMKKMLLITASVALLGAVTTAHAEGAGENTYKMACFACHGTGAAGAPKFGDKTAWAPHIAKGKDTLYNHAINGFKGNSGVMPPKGGRTDLSDADVKAAVDYMVSNSK